MPCILTAEDEHRMVQLPFFNVRRAGASGKPVYSLGFGGEDYHLWLWPPRRWGEGAERKGRALTYEGKSWRREKRLLADLKSNRRQRAYHMSRGKSREPVGGRGSRAIS